MVDGAVRKLFGVLQPSDIGTQFIPGNVFRLFMQDVGKIVKILSLIHISSSAILP